jgi:hypothetical protein
MDRTPAWCKARRLHGEWSHELLGQIHRPAPCSPFVSSPGSCVHTVRLLLITTLYNTATLCSKATHSQLKGTLLQAHSTNLCFFLQELLMHTKFYFMECSISLSKMLTWIVRLKLFQQGVCQERRGNKLAAPSTQLSMTRTCKSNRIFGKEPHTTREHYPSTYA